MKNLRLISVAESWNKTASRRINVKRRLAVGLIAGLAVATIWGATGILPGSEPPQVAADGPVISPDLPGDVDVGPISEPTALATVAFAIVTREDFAGPDGWELLEVYGGSISEPTTPATVAFPIVTREDFAGRDGREPLDVYAKADRESVAPGVVDFRTMAQESFVGRE